MPLRVEHFQVDTMEEQNREWLILARKRMASTHEAIAATSEILHSLAAHRHGRYDGWQIQLD